MKLEQLNHLKEQLLNGKDFGEIYTYFLDHFGESEEFMRLGVRVRHPALEAIYTQILGQVFKREIDVKQLLLSHLPEQGFVHGSGVFQGEMACVIYFEDVNAGLIVITSPFQSKDTKFIRFSMKQRSRIAEPSLN